MMDIFQRSMDSDQFISGIYIYIRKTAAQHKKQALPWDVMELLEAPHNIVVNNVQSLPNVYSFDDDSESDETNASSFELAVERNWMKIWV